MSSAENVSQPLIGQWGCKPSRDWLIGAVILAVIGHCERSVEMRTFPSMAPVRQTRQSWAADQSTVTTGVT